MSGLFGSACVLTTGSSRPQAVCDNTVLSRLNPLQRFRLTQQNMPFVLSQRILSALWMHGDSPCAFGSFVSLTLLLTLDYNGVRSARG